MLPKGHRVRRTREVENPTLEIEEQLRPHNDVLHGELCSPTGRQGHTDAGAEADGFPGLGWSEPLRLRGKEMRNAVPLRPGRVLLRTPILLTKQKSSSGSTA